MSPDFILGTVLVVFCRKFTDTLGRKSHIKQQDLSFQLKAKTKAKALDDKVKA